MNIGGMVKNSFVDYPSEIACVVFTNGCNLNCWYCHNRHLIAQNNTSLTETEVINFLISHKPFLSAVTISGGEPTLQQDLPEFIKKIKNLGYKVKLDTNGTNFTMLQNLIKENLLDYVSLDVKAPLNRYSKVSKISSVSEIEKSINLLKQNVVPCEFRTTVAPNLTLEDIENIAKTIAGTSNYSLQQFRVVPMSVGFEGTCYNKCFKLPPLAEDFFKKAYNIAKKYVTNVTIKGL